MSTAARLGSSGSRVSGWSTLEYVATAETARVSSRAYGAADCARCCALMMRDAAMSSMARVIFFIDSVDLIRARYSRSETAMPLTPLLLDDLLLLELVVGGRVDDRVGARVDRTALGGLELLQEVVVRLLELAVRVVGEVTRLADAGEDPLLGAAEVLQELVLEAEHVVHGHLVEAARGAGPQGDGHLLDRVGR